MTIEERSTPVSEMDIAQAVNATKGIPSICDIIRRMAFELNWLRLTGKTAEPWYCQCGHANPQSIGKCPSCGRFGMTREDGRIVCSSPGPAQVIGVRYNAGPSGNRFDTGD